MRKISILLGSAALFSAVPAMAQDGEDKGFNGIYIGAAVGADVQPNDQGASVLFDRNLDGRYDNTVLTGTGANAFSPGFCNGAARSANAGNCRNDKDDVGYYGRVGFDHQNGSFVVGALGEFGKSNITDSTTAFSVTPASYQFTRKIDWEASIRGRVGYTPNSTTLFYGTFGPSYAKIDNSFVSSQSTNTFTGRGRSREWGVNGGGGVEQRIGRNFSIGLEYMYHQYNKDDYRVRVAGPAGTPFTNAANGGTVNGTDLRRSDDKFRWHSIRATAAFRF